MALREEYPPLVGKSHPITKLPKTFPTEICEDLTLGIDIGVGSCGLALVHKTGKDKPTYKGLEYFPSTCPKPRRSRGSSSRIPSAGARGCCAAL
jgi:hypothetical protein